LQAEVKAIIDFTFDVYRKFGFTEFLTFVATRPEKSQGSDEDWELATNSLKTSLQDNGLEFGIKEGEGAFYGPKIEFNIKDSLGRLWQCGTIQVDFSMPNRFELEYTANDGKKHRPVMLHRAIYGSLERFIGILIEHFEGKFPLWLSPVQMRILTVAEPHSDYASDLASELTSQGYRIETDLRNEKIGAKIREAILRKVNYLVIIGDKEVAGNTVSIRKRGEETTESMDKNTFFQLLSSDL
jgi:threonyl-tRNA synthetase